MTRVIKISAADDITKHPNSLSITLPDSVTFIKGTCQEETQLWSAILQDYMRSKDCHKSNAIYANRQSTIFQMNRRIQKDADMINVLKTTVPLMSTVSTINPMRIANGVSQKSYFGNSTVTVGSDKLPIYERSDNNNSNKSIKDNYSKNIFSLKCKLWSEDKNRKRIINQQRYQIQQYQQHRESKQSQAFDIAATSNKKLDLFRKIHLEHHKETADKLLNVVNSLAKLKIQHTKQKISNLNKNAVVGSFIDEDKLIREDPDGCGLDAYDVRYSPSSELRVNLLTENLLNVKKGWLMKQRLNEEWNKYWFVLIGRQLLYYRDPGAEEKGITEGIINLNAVIAINSLLVNRNYGFKIVTRNERDSTILSAVTVGIRSSWISIIRRIVNLSDVKSPPNIHALYKIKKANINNQSSVLYLIEKERESTSTSVTSPSILVSSDEEYRTASEGGRLESGDWSEMLTSLSVTRNDKWSKQAKKSIWAESRKWDKLPPSPPLRKTEFSKVKARSCSSSRSRICKRKQCLPSSLQDSILNIVKSDKLGMACYKLSLKQQNNNLLSINNYLSKSNDNLLVFDKNKKNVVKNQIYRNKFVQNSLLVILECQKNEIENLKSQLNAVCIKLVDAENKICIYEQQKNEASFRENRVDELLSKIQITEQQRNKYMEDIDKIKKLYNHDKELLESKFLKNEKLLQQTSEKCQILTNELASSHIIQQHLQTEVTILSYKLTQGIEENEQLCIRVGELERKNCFSSSKDCGRTFDSLSDLTNVDLDINLITLSKKHIIEEYEELRNRFGKAILEIRVMRKELREAHNIQDDFELQIFSYKQEFTRSNKSNQAQIQLMAAKIQDLTNKLTNSEKQMRILKHKLSKIEIRDKRRSLTLKEQGSSQIVRQIDNKLLNFEQNIHTIEPNKYDESTIIIAKTLKILNHNLLKNNKKKNRIFYKNIARRKLTDCEIDSESLKEFMKLCALISKFMNIKEPEIIQERKRGIGKDLSLSCLFNIFNTNNISLKVLSRFENQERAATKSNIWLEKYLISKQRDKTENLRLINEILDRHISYKKNQINLENIDLIMGIVLKLQLILKNKIHEINTKWQLADIGEINYKEKINLIIARVTFEFILLKQIKYVIEEILGRRIMLNDLVKTSQLILNLKFKVYGIKSKIYQNRNYIQYFIKLFINKLLFINGVSKYVKNFQEVSAMQTNSLNFLLRKQKELNKNFINCKNEKFVLLAQGLVVETLNLFEQIELGNQFTITKKKKMDDKRIQDIWISVQESLYNKIIQVEVSSYIRYYAQIDENSILYVMSTCLNFNYFDYFYEIDLKQWAHKAKVILKQEIKNTMDELTIIYKKCLLQLNKSKNNTNIKYNLRQLLADYTSVVANKALIDAQIILLQEDTKNKIIYSKRTFISSLIQYEGSFSLISDKNYAFRNNFYETEYIYFYQQFLKECKIFNKVQSQEQVKNIALLLIDIANDIDKLRQQFKERMNEENDPFNWPKLFVIETDWVSIFNKCSEIQKQIRQLTNYVQSMMCKRCKQLQHKIQWLNSKHYKELQELKNIQKKDLMQIKDEWNSKKISLTIQYEHELANLQERIRKLEHQLNLINTKHSADVSKFQAVYQRSINADTNIEVMSRKRYKEEIKQLKNLCEKGLLVMENSHKRVISELEEKHRYELENLQIEKEQALSEETQATLAALDAMRKAHEHEVKKEIAKFKENFIRQTQTREEIEVLHKKHEQKISAIKQEILSLSTKYSMKCMKSATLEEKVNALTKQLTEAQECILKLDARNKQLCTHLILEINDSKFRSTIQVLKKKRQ